MSFPRQCVLLVAGLAVAAPAVASAQHRSPAEPTIVAVVEATPSQLNPGALRARIAAALGAQVIELDEHERVERGLLAVALTAGGTVATIRYVPHRDAVDAISVSVRARGRHDALGAWLVGPCVSVIRAAESGAFDAHPGADVVDPWTLAGDTRHAVTTTASVDPWEGTPRTPEPPAWHLESDAVATHTTETDDPWAGVPRAAAPAPQPAAYAPGDPWAYPPPATPRRSR